MNLLLDTHVALWGLVDAKRMPDRIAALLTEPANTIFVSAASIWEIAIKFALRREPGILYSGSDALARFKLAGCHILDVTAAHAAAIDGLPKLHGDPFDRLLVAQALTEPMRLVSHDAKLAAYGDIVISW